MSSGTPTRYQQLADELASSIRSGVLRPGDRLPSVRDLRRQRGVSPSTIFQAYAQLESQGLVEARARSGHFVRVRRLLTGQPPEAAQPSGRVTPVAISGLVFELLGSTRDADVVPLGSAFGSRAVPVRGAGAGWCAGHASPGPGADIGRADCGR